MLQESVPKPDQGLRNPFAHAVQRTLSFLVCLLTPPLQDAAGRAAVGWSQAALVSRQPEGCEVGVQLFPEHRLQIGFDERRPRQVHVVSEQAQSRTVGHDTPQARIFGVQELLHQGVGSLPPTLVSKTRVSLVQIPLRKCQQHGHRVLAGPVGKRKVPIFCVNRLGPFQIFVSKHGPDQRNRPVPVRHAATALRDPALPLLVLFELIAGNAPVARYLVS